MEPILLRLGLYRLVVVAVDHKPVMMQEIQVYQAPVVVAVDWVKERLQAEELEQTDKVIEVVPVNQVVRSGHIGVDPAAEQVQQAEQQVLPAALVDSGWMATIMLVVEVPDFQLEAGFRMVAWAVAAAAIPH